MAVAVGFNNACQISQLLYLMRLPLSSVIEKWLQN